MPLEPEFEKQVRRVAHSLIGRGWMMATAESCTGGWIAKCCTDLAGSSAWFERGFVTYSNDAKREMLEVCRKELEVDGAVSRTVAMQMAKGARRKAGVEAAVSVTGIAGPAGGTDEKPVGTVWFGFATKGRPTEAECMYFTGDRESIRRQTVIYALSGLALRLESG